MDCDDEGRDWSDAEIGSLQMWSSKEEVIRVGSQCNMAGPYR